MTIEPQTPARSLTQMVALRIKHAMVDEDVLQSQLARRIGKTEQWLSVRLRGRQAIDLNDLMLIANGLGVGVHDLLPPAEEAAAASVSVRNPSLTDRTPSRRRHRSRGREDTPAPRPDGRPSLDGRRPPGGPRRTARLPRPEAA